MKKLFAIGIVLLFCVSTLAAAQSANIGHNIYDEDGNKEGCVKGGKGCIYT